MKIAIIDGDISYPATSGKRLRTLNLMLPLARRHQITYIGRGAPGSVEMREAPAFLRDHGIEPILVPHPIAKKSGLSFYARLAANLFSPLPYSVASHQSPEMRAALSQLAQERRIDLWQFEWTGYLPALDPAISAPRLVVAHNVDTLIWQRYYENEKRPAQRWYLNQQWCKFEAFERRAFHEADRVVAVSPDDAQRIRTQFSQDKVDVVDNGVDRAYFAQVQGTRDPRAILFLGALDWRPNLDAVGLLLDKIFPEVRQREPEAKLWIVGRNPPASLVERVRAMPGITLHANVADVRQYLSEATVMAVPLRIGGGSRLKILEALAASLPVVSSRVGAEGLDFIPGQHYVQAEEDRMAEALVDVLHQPEPILAMTQVAQERVLPDYDWDGLAKKLEQSWETCHADFYAAHAPSLAGAR